MMPPDVEIDVEGRRLVLCGEQVMVGSGMVLHGDTGDVAWFTVLCGESPWWVDLGVRLDGTLTATPCDWRWPEPETTTAVDTLDLIAELSITSAKPRRMGLDLDPFCGMEPGSWVWFEDWAPC